MFVNICGKNKILLSCSFSAVIISIEHIQKMYDSIKNKKKFKKFKMHDVANLKSVPQMSAVRQSKSFFLLNFFFCKNIY